MIFNDILPATLGYIILSLDKGFPILLLFLHYWQFCSVQLQNCLSWWKLLRFWGSSPPHWVLSRPFLFKSLLFKSVFFRSVFLKSVFLKEYFWGWSPPHQDLPRPPDLLHCLDETLEIMFCQLFTCWPNLLPDLSYYGWKWFLSFDELTYLTARRGWSRSARQTLKILLSRHS